MNLALILCLFTSLVLSATTPGYVHVPISRRPLLAPLLGKRGLLGEVLTQLRSDAGYAEGKLENKVFEYIAELEIGSPKQKVEASLDTGSSDLWVFSAETGSKLSYNSTESSTYDYINDQFDIQYVTGDAKGDWAKDVVSFGGVDVQDQQFAVVDSVDPQYFDCGVFGIGFVQDESIPSDQQYPNFPQSLVDQGLISRNAYSLYLNDLHAETGSVLFGGIDYAKFTGELISVPIIKQSSKFLVEARIKGFGNSSSKDLFNTILDCGTTFSYLPTKLADEIADKFGATLDPNLGLYFLDEKPSGSSKASITFEFDNGAEIVIPQEEFILESSYFGEGLKPYVLATTNNDGLNGMSLLGDTFHRSAYVVYDLDKREVSLAQASYSSKSDIRAI